MWVFMKDSYYSGGRTHRTLLPSYGPPLMEIFIFEDKMGKVEAMQASEARVQHLVHF